MTPFYVLMTFCLYHRLRLKKTKETFGSVSEILEPGKRARTLSEPETDELSVYSSLPSSLSWLFCFLFFEALLMTSTAAASTAAGGESPSNNVRLR